MGKRFEKEYEVHYYEVNARLECNITAIINFFGDIGTWQSDELGVGIDYLTQRSLAWVFYKYDIDVKRYPKYGEKLRVITEPTAFKKFYASRSYEIYDHKNELIVEGSAIFLLIDTNRRRAVRIPEEQFDFYGVDVEKNNDIVIEKLEKLKEEMNSKEFVVRYSDIDSNMHVNNSKYLEWSIEAVPLEIIKNYKMNKISIVFEKECSYGSEIKASCEIREEEDSTLTILHKIEDKEGKNLTSLISKWHAI